mgnify:CR=1 FL=1
MQTQRRMKPLLGTFVEVGAQAVSATLLAPAIAAAFEALERVQQRMSFHAPDSELTRLNQSEGAWVPLSRETVRVLRLARATMLASGGLFDPTVGGLLIRHGALPDHGAGTPLDRGEAFDMQLALDSARLLRPVRLTLDGLAKGHAVDQAIHALRAWGVEGGWVNAGGDLRVFGVASLPVQQRTFGGQLRALGTLREAAMASSRTVKSSRDWAAKGTLLLGVRAVIAESFERIHRSNLIGMGILPLRLPAERHPNDLHLRPGDQILIDADPARISPRCVVPVTIRRVSGESETFTATAAIETGLEVEILRGGGIIPLILRRVTNAEATSRETPASEITGNGESLRREALPSIRR